jgi:hypothetical protein
MFNFAVHAPKDKLMKNREEIEDLEKVIGQLKGAHSEISQLAKKSPNDSLNKFKLNLINKVVESGNLVLGDKYRPFSDFEKFDADDVPTTSDVTMVLAQYMEEAERYRSDNVAYGGGTWHYVVDGKLTSVQAGAPTKVGRK